MPEVTPDATLMIATSWQALGRAKTGDERTMICNCTVIIVFAGFFIEANISHIIEVINKTEELHEYAGTKRPGIQDKLAWFYNSYISESKNKDKAKVYPKLRDAFPEFGEIYNFRNKVAHGEIDLSQISKTRRG